MTIDSKNNKVTVTSDSMEIVLMRIGNDKIKATYSDELVDDKVSDKNIDFIKDNMRYFKNNKHIEVLLVAYNEFKNLKF
jgi:hypothetical protein